MGRSSTERRKVVFLLLDAFRGDYVNPIDTPFLQERIRSGVFARRMRSTAGFNQRTTICTGANGRQSNTFTMFTFDPEGSPFRFTRRDPRRFLYERAGAAVERIPSWPIARQVRGAARLLYRRRRARFLDRVERRAKRRAHNAPVAHIPLSILHLIGVIEDQRPLHLPGSCRVETIFDVFAREGVTYRYLMYPEVANEDDAVLEALLEARDSDASVLLGQFCDTDAEVHRCGPSSSKRRAVVGEVDRKIRQLADAFGDETTFILVGDHGMTDVKEELDVPRLLRPLEKAHGIRMGRDYLLFLDSTMARFRCLKPKAAAFLSKVQEHEVLRAKGTFVDDGISERYGLPLEPRYGDLIWWADLGVLLFPDYFHDRQTHDKGMHGYRSEHDDMKGCFLAFGPGIEGRELGEVRLVDVCPSICAAVGVSAPSSSQGTCLV